MKLGIMQPYYLPYIGYWQLLSAVDTYVIYDDVNYINRGWINRNRILIDGKPAYFNVPMLKASQNKKIDEIQVNADAGLRKKNLRTLEMAYKKAPYFQEVFPLAEKIINSEETLLSEYLADSIAVICGYLDIKTKRLMSSSIAKNNELKGQDKILEICRLLGADEYYNAEGGQKLYSYEKFQAEGIQLKFLKCREIRYRQFGEQFEPNLSIIDVLMFNSKNTVLEMLSDYELITK